VLSLFSSRRNWDSPTPSPAGECAPPPLGERGWGNPNSDEGTYTVVIYIYMYFGGPVLCQQIYNQHYGKSILYSIKYFQCHHFSYCAILCTSNPAQFCTVHDIGLETNQLWELGKKSLALSMRIARLLLRKGYKFHNAVKGLHYFQSFPRTSFKNKENFTKFNACNLYKCIRII
jgi:hypothetical protein